MKKKSEQPDDELRPEYDFRSLRVVARGPGRKKPEDITIQLAPDVAEAFPDSGSVNDAGPDFLSNLESRATDRASHLERRSARSPYKGWHTSRDPEGQWYVQQYS
jgi:hypothetical protein